MAEPVTGTAAAGFVARIVGVTRKPGVAACVVAAAVSLTAGMAVFHLLKEHYAAARMAAVFPDRNHHAGTGNGVVAAPKAGRRIVLFGDSRIAQWRNFPAPGDAELVMRGGAGETTAQMRFRFESDVLALDPDIVVLQLGINDLVAIGALPDRQAEIVSQCAANIRYFVDALRARNIRIVLLTIIPPGAPPVWRRPVWSGQISAEVEKLNRYWLAAPASPVLHVIDARSLLQDAQGRWLAGVTADSLHLTQQGYERLNAAVAPLLRSRDDAGKASRAPVRRGA